MKFTHEAFVLLKVFIFSVVEIIIESLLFASPQYALNMTGMLAGEPYQQTS